MKIENMPINFKKGLSKIKSSLEHCPKGPGIYQFLNKKKEILYIGKAKNINNRLSSYLNFNILSNRIKRLVGNLDNLKFIKTHTEIDALILESNLIKKYKPIFNIRLIDDKSFPFIMISNNHKWPRLQKFRGSRDKNNFYFGPFASVNSVEKVMTILEKGFLLRTCSDSYFSNRKKPCLLFQIKRCSAPCTKNINNIEYNELVQQAKLFLKGKDTKIRDNLVSKMNIASFKQKYEEAALFRDRIKALSKISQEQYSSIGENQNFDIICVIKKIDTIYIQNFFFRNGKNLGNKEFIFENHDEKSSNAILEDFLTLFYYSHTPPNVIVLNKKIENSSLIESAIKKNKKKKVKIYSPQKGKKFDLIKMVEENIKFSIKKNENNKKKGQELIKELSNTFNLNIIPNRIEVYDNSHLSGSNPVGVMIVFEGNRFSRESYRKFNISVPEKNSFDDYLMLEQVLRRRFSNKIKSSKSAWKNNLPELILIDGGKGHLNIAERVLKESKLSNIFIMSIAKGENRNAGNETIFYADTKKKIFKNDKILFFLQRLRDEAHRFAISSQRYKRKNEIKNSIFDPIPGIGSKNKKKLLSYFGSIENIKTAGIRDLENTPGIGKVIARKIYNEFNEND
tara:strand:- start:40 stop:1908 length:1869 start_codon:yes stop_codon:yes gene_type:complete